MSIINNVVNKLSHLLQPPNITNEIINIEPQPTVQLTKVHLGHQNI